MKLLNYLPENRQDIVEYKLIFESEDTEIQNLNSLVKRIYDNCFFDTMDVNGCYRWELMMGIRPLDSDTIEDRRFRIKTRYNEKLPFTLDTLNNSLQALVGNDYIMSIDGYTLTIRIDLGVKKQFDYVVDMLERFIPANILCDVSLLFNTHKLLGDYTHQQLSTLTHKQIREDVMPNGYRND